MSGTVRRIIKDEEEEEKEMKQHFIRQLTGKTEVINEY